MNQALLAAAIEPARSTYFEQLGVACLVIGRGLELIDANARARALIAQGALGKDRGGRLALPGDILPGDSLPGHAHGQRLARLVAEAGGSGHARGVFRIGLGRWLVLSLARIEAGAEYVALARVAGRHSTPDIASVSAAFDLTADEAAVLDHLARGLCLKDVAAHLDLTIHAARTHLRTIHARMGVRSTGEMFRLLLVLAEIDGRC